MSDLISRSALIEDIKRRKYINKPLTEIFETIIDEQPPVEAAPAVRGEWKPVERVLERLEELRMKEYDASDEELELRDVEDWFDEGESSGRFKAYGEAIEIIKEEFGCES